jgi:uncharacterized protein YdeI (YjbR/CyaY-like superfamily)
MGKRDQQVDAYIAKSAEFAQPILRHIRDVVHAASPAIEETMKWSFPHFVHNGIVCSMAAFKEHCAFGFWKERLIFGERERGEAEGMGQFGRIRSVADLPPRQMLIRWVRKAVKLNEAGVAVRRPTGRRRDSDDPVPDAFRAALSRNPAAAAAFERLAPGQRREYLEWFAEAKREETRERRIATAVEWLAEGKPRNWKYMKARMQDVAR